VSCAKTAEPNETPFEILSRTGPWNTYYMVTDAPTAGATSGVYGRLKHMIKQNLGVR